MCRRPASFLLSLVVLIWIGKSRVAVHGWAVTNIATRSAVAAAAAAADNNATPTHSKIIENDLNTSHHEYEDSELSAWEVLAGNVANCLVQSDLKRDSGFDGSSTGWTSWVEQSSAFRLQKCMDKIIFMDIGSSTTSTCTHQDDDDKRIRKFNLAVTTRTTSDQDDDLWRWLKWIKSSPAPMMVELSESLRSAVNVTITEKALEQVEQTREAFLARIACRLILLPSGMSLQNNIRTAPGAMVYGKQLYGGATRYRIIGNQNQQQQRKRKAGERTVIAQQGLAQDAWMQYGGPERNYDAIDIGPCALMEMTILPKGLRVPELGETKDDIEMYIQNGKCNPALLFGFPAPLAVDPVEMQDPLSNEIDLSGSEQLLRLESRFTSVVGGLTTEIEAIVRRVLDGRVIVQGSSSSGDRANEMKMMLELGLHPVRGLLLYGPPGCGKTALAREISRLLTERPPKIVSAPELLDRWVGGSEKLVRDLFGDAESELRMCNGDLTKSGLHVVVIDEVDAVFRKRSSASDSGEVARASAVNQILAKLDGVNALGNVLLIAATNRPELLDDALLRPGRLEVQVEVPLPDKTGRREILQIHFAPLRKRGRLSKSLCEAIDGVKEKVCDSSMKRKLSLAFTYRSESHRSIKDLAADKWTRGFSGADIQGLVRCAGSIALSRARRDGSSVDGLLITVEDVREALSEVRQ